jgi:putative ABC transport system permease protein
VQSVAANEALPMSGYDAPFEFEIQGQPLPPARFRPLANRNVVTGDYFQTLHIPVLQGRGFEPGDERAGAPPVIIISQRLAEEYFGNANPIAQHLRHAGQDATFREIIGVVGDIRRGGLAQPISPETYTPLNPGVGSMVIVIRTDAPERLIRALPAAVAEVQPEVGVWPRLMDTQMRNTLGEAYRISGALGAFAATALLLATLGVYALVSYSTGLKTREMGIRSALGSPPGKLIWLIMRGGLACLLVGGALGMLAGLLLGKGLSLGIPGIRAFDPGVSALVAVCLGTAGAIASFLPAWRALRASPAAALRYE